MTGNSREQHGVSLAQLGRVVRQREPCNDTVTCQTEQGRGIRELPYSAWVEGIIKIKWKNFYI